MYFMKSFDIVMPTNFVVHMGLSLLSPENIHEIVLC